MEQLSICRCCLATDVKLYDMCKYQLQAAYESLCGVTVDKTELYSHLCVYCGTIMSKFTQFRDRCLQSQSILDNLHNQHNLITKDLIKQSSTTIFPYKKQFIHVFDNSVPIVVKTELRCEVDSMELMNKLNEHLAIGKSDDNYDNCNYNKDNYKTDNYANDDYVADNCDNDNYTTDNCDSGNYKLDNDNHDNSGEGDLGSDEEPLSWKVNRTKDNMMRNDDDTLLAVLDELNSKDHCEEIDFDMIILSKEEQIEEVQLRQESNNYTSSMYKCDKCFKGFMTESTYNNHMVRHEPSTGPVLCDICHTYLPSVRALKTHSINSHERKYTCKLCGLIAKTHHKAKEHSMWHKGRIFVCRVCDASFRKSTTYLSHIRIRHPSSYSCDQCGESFIGEYGLSMHKKRVQCRKKLETQYKCSICGFQFRNEVALKMHETFIVDGACGADMLFCSECGNTFSSEGSLQSHLKTHDTITTVNKCTQCPKSFSSEIGLAAHYKRKHQGSTNRSTDVKKDELCICEMCGYKCKSYCLVLHQRTHTGEKPYPCTICPKRFSAQQSLQLHMRTHTGERPFKCTRCPKAFSHKAGLNRHNLVHTGVKPYTCPHCSKSFSQSNSLKQHCAGVHMKTGQARIRIQKQNKNGE